VGQILHLDLPESGTVRVSGDTGSKEYSGSSINITADAPGKYKVEYNSPSYTGKGMFFATGKLVISASVNGKVLQPGATIKPGDKITVTVSYSNGKQAEDATIYVSMPATAYGLDEKMAMILALSGNSQFEPPCNIKSEYHQSQIFLAVPEIHTDKEGILTISAEGNEFCTGGQVSFVIKPNIPLYAQKPVQAAGIIVSCGFLITVLLYKRDLYGMRNRLNAVIGLLLRRGGGKEFDDLY